MSSITQDCEEYQITLERRQAGELGPGEAAELEAHLLGCEECQGYQRQMERILVMIKASDAKFETKMGGRRRRRVNPHSVRRQVRANRSVARYSMITIIALSLGLLVEGFDEERGPSWLGITSLVLSVVTIAAMGRDTRRMLALAEAPGDFLKLAHSEVRTRAACMKALAFILVVLGVLGLGSGLPRSLVWLPGMGGGGMEWPTLLLGLALLAGALHVIFSILPRLRRELSEYE